MAKRILFRNRVFWALLLTIFSNVAMGPAWAQSERPTEHTTEHTLVRRISVFPIKYNQPELAKVMDEAWWEMRETLTRDKRFLVASKNFLQQKDVYQARSLLSPADAIILGNLLDANALITTYLDDRVMYMKAYEGVYGRLLWEHQINLQPSLLLAQQIQPAVVRLIQDFVASIPYQGFVVLDPIKGRPLYQEGSHTQFEADVGSTAEIEVGDPVQLIRVQSDNLKPLFTHTSSIEVIAEGKVVEHTRDHIMVDVDQINRSIPVREGTLVRLPKEKKRLDQLYAIRDSLKTKIDPQFLSPGVTSAKQAESETKPLVSSLVFIMNLAAFLLLAF